MITALMKKQVMALEEKGIIAESLSSTETSSFRNKVSLFLNSFSFHNQSAADLCCQWLHIHVIYSLMANGKNLLRRIASLVSRRRQEKAQMCMKGKSTLTICEPRPRRL